MNNFIKKFIVILIVLLLIIAGVLFFFFKNKEDSVEATVDKIDMNVDTDDGDLQIDWSLYQIQDCNLSESLTITKEGIYNLTGEINDGLVKIDVDENVKLVLNNVSITNSSGPAILVVNAKNVVIELEDGSKNYLEDSESYEGYEEDEIGTIFSHDDLVLQGTGSLEVVANCEDAIVSKDDLKIGSGIYDIKAQDDGIRGKDSVYILGGNFNISVKGDGIKSTNDTDSNKGFIKIENGNFKIDANGDGIQAETNLLIQDGSFDIKTGGGSSNVSTSDTWGNWGTKNLNGDAASAKGVKAGKNILIQSGEFKLDTSDDAIHSNGYVGIKDGNFLVSSGDDGIHADEELIIDDGEINISKSYEGLEASKITINDGEINVIASDDGINVAGGNDGSSQGGRPGANNFASNSNNILTINGGNIVVDASGDGLDANGSIYINGGMIKVYGPSNSANGALDYDKELVVRGGTLLASGSSGMLQGCSSGSTIYNLTIVFSSTYGENDKITIVDDENKEIVSFESIKSYSSLVIALPELKKGENYSLKVNGSVIEDFTIEELTTSIGKRGGGFNQGGVPGSGGNRGDMPRGDRPLGNRR